MGTGCFGGGKAKCNTEKITCDATKFVDTNKDCKGDPCVEKDDKDTCCQPKAKCSTITGDKTCTAPKVFEGTLLCKTATCGTIAEEPQCCKGPAQAATGASLFA